MAIVPIAPWLNGLQVIALLVTGDLECTAESLRREDESADTRRVLTADETRTRARRMLAEMRDDLDTDKTRKGLEKFLASGLPNRPPAYEVGGDGSENVPSRPACCVQGRHVGVGRSLTPQS